MNSNMTTKILRAKRTTVGRTCCRLLGDRTGAVLMEYVILGVMIAAAAVVAVIFFGNQIVGGFSTMINAITGNTQGAQQQAQQNQQAVGGQVQAAQGYNNAVAPGAGAAGGNR